MNVREVCKHKFWTMEGRQINEPLLGKKENYLGTLDVQFMLNSVWTTRAKVKVNVLNKTH